MDILGEVQVNPSGNTVLDRLKTIASNQLPDDHQVAVSNIGDTPLITGFATETTLAGITTPSTPYKLVSAASTNATSLKGSAGVIYGIQLTNVNASPRYLKLYNKASAPTVGTDTPVKTLIIPGNTTGAGSNVPISVRGINFSTGIAFALTTESADTGTTGVAANEIVVNIDYI
jgi:hypothetical protein